MAQLLRPTSDISNDGYWHASNSPTSTLWKDNDSATLDTNSYTIGPYTNSLESIYECGIAAGVSPGVTTGHVIHIVCSCGQATSQQVQLDVREGSNTRATLVAQITQDIVEYTYTLTSAEAGSIALYNDLSLRFRQQITGGPANYVLVYQMWLEVPGGDVIGTASFSPAAAFTCPGGLEWNGTASMTPTVSFTAASLVTGDVIGMASFAPGATFTALAGFEITGAATFAPSAIFTVSTYGAILSPTSRRDLPSSIVPPLTNLSPTGSRRDG